MLYITMAAIVPCCKSYDNYVFLFMACSFTAISFSSYDHFPPCGRQWALAYGFPGGFHCPRSNHDKGPWRIQPLVAEIQSSPMVDEWSKICSKADRLNACFPKLPIKVFVPCIHPQALWNELSLNAGALAFLCWGGLRLIELCQTQLLFFNVC